MNFQDELRRNLRDPAAVQKEQTDRLTAALKIEATQTLERLRNEMVNNAKSAHYVTTGTTTTISAICPMPQRFIRKRHWDNTSQLIANNKLGIFKNRSIVYQVWYSFDLDPNYEAEYRQFTSILRQLASADEISVDFLLYDTKMNQCYPFPTSLDGFQFDFHFILAVKGVSQVKQIAKSDASKDELPHKKSNTSDQSEAKSSHKDEGAERERNHSIPSTATALLNRVEQHHKEAMSLLATTQLNRSVVQNKEVVPSTTAHPSKTPPAFKGNIPEMSSSVTDKSSDYADKRKRDAVHYLRNIKQGTAFISDDSSAEQEIEKCEFILTSNTIAAKYLTAYNGFLYSEAIKENFKLPVDIPDKGKIIGIYFNDLLREVAEEDPKLAVEIWGWCIKEFGPYSQYMANKRTLYNNAMCCIDDCPEEFLDIVAQTIGTDTEFRNGLLTKSPEFPGCCSPIIARALKNNLPKEASLIFTAAILNPSANGKDLEELINRIIYDCSDWKEIETMEAFKLHILPIIEKMENKRIRRLYPKFAEKVDYYITSLEKYSEHYQYSGRYAWRKTCTDGSKYGVDPLDYETEDEYNQAIYDEKYDWRNWVSYSPREYGVDPDEYETEEEFNAAAEKARNKLKGK